MSRVIAFVIAILWIVADYFSKQWALQTLSQGYIEVTSWFNLYLAFNPGAAFSFLAGENGWQRWLFALLAIAVALWLIYTLLFDKHHWLARFGYASILGGALGNLYDRLIHGKVVDFIQVHWQENYFPTFNIADSAITIGVIALIVAALFTGKKAK